METLQAVMKGKLLIFVFILFQSCATTKFNCVDKKSCIEIEYNLETISDFIFYSIGNVESVVKSAKFMENVSGHNSEADIQFDGQQPPTMNDYYTWTAWYSVNYNRLRYNKKDKRVYLLPEKDG